jgi:hypothetical protein
LGPNGEALVVGRGRFRCAYGKWGLRSGEIGPELAGGKLFQGAEAVGEFVGGQAALAAEGAEKIFSGSFAFLGVATGAAGNEVAVRILAPAGERDDMVEAAGAWGELGQAIETEVAVAGVNGRAAGFRQQEIRLLEAGGARPAGEAGGHRSVRCGGANFVGQEKLNDVASASAFDEAQSALFDESAHSLTSGSGGEANAAGEPENGKTELELPFEARVAQEMVIDHALNEIEPEPRHESIFDLLQDESGVGDAGVCFAVFHDLSPIRDVVEQSVVPRSGATRNPSSTGRRECR